VELSEAWRELGMRPTPDPAEVRRGYFARLRELHPDRSDAADATEATIRLTAAYRKVPAHLRHEERSGSGTDRSIVLDDHRVVPISMVADDTIAVALSPAETYGMLLETAYRLGELTHAEPSSSLLSVLVEFVHGPVCQLLLTLQPRATGVTEIRCAVEPVDGDLPPPIDAVTRLILSTLVSVHNNR
jgi:hypothetical protein